MSSNHTTAEHYYLTTPIYYVNARPHLGHAYSTIVCDAIARQKRALGVETWFLTGTDEHGQKIERSAKLAGRTPAEFATLISAEFRGLWDKLGLTYDDYIRTTEPRHVRGVQKLFATLRDKGYIYKGSYTGQYCVSDEAWVEVAPGAPCPDCGRITETVSEENYFFKLSAFENKLLKFYEENPGFIGPESTRREVISFVRSGLKDLSVSRTSFDWGVKVPGHEDHVMYVWVDALTNYLTGLGYPDDTAEVAKFWPADLHLIGKDIVRFHTVYWPAFLMSAGLAVPKQVFGHGFLLNRGQKESKSLGNVTDPMQLADRYGVDVLRYFFVREVTFGQDGSYSLEAIVTRANAELANSFGNLAQRTLSLIYKNCDGHLPPIFGHTEADDALFEEVARAVREEIPEAFERLALSQACEAWMRAVFACNAYIDEQAPWALRKTDPERMKTVLATLYIAIVQLAVAISPVIPGSAKKLLDAMGFDPALRTLEGIHSHWYSPLAESGYRLAQPVGVFPRLELPEEAA